MTIRTTWNRLLAVIAFCAAAAIPTLAPAEEVKDIAGVWRFDGANQGPEEVTITKIGDFAYKLEVMNTSTHVSRWEMLGYFRDGILNAVGIDRPGYGVRMASCWTGTFARPGVIDIRYMKLPGNVGYTAKETWSTAPVQLVKLR